MKERPPIWRVAANISSRGEPTKGGPPACGVGRGANNSCLSKSNLSRNIYRHSLGPGVIFWYGSGQGQLADTCECGNEPSGSIKCGEFLD